MPPTPPLRFIDDADDDAAPRCDVIFVPIIGGGRIADNDDDAAAAADDSESSSPPLATAAAGCFTSAFLLLLLMLLKPPTLPPPPPPLLRLDVLNSAVALLSLQTKMDGLFWSYMYIHMYILRRHTSVCLPNVGVVNK